MPPSDYHEVKRLVEKSFLANAAQNVELLRLSCIGHDSTKEMSREAPTGFRVQGKRDAFYCPHKLQMLMLSFARLRRGYHRVSNHRLAVLALPYPQPDMPAPLERLCSWTRLRPRRRRVQRRYGRGLARNGRR
jgi:hypothetical protein